MNDQSSDKEYATEVEGRAALNESIRQVGGAVTNEERASPDELLETSESEATDREYLDPEQAARYVGVSHRDLNELMKEYGIGRYHVPELADQVFYAREDLEELREVVASRRPATKGDVPPPEVARDKVAEASWESFPASDPPAH